MLWRDFIEHYWEQAPTVWRDLCEPGMITADGLFATVVAMPSRSKSDRFWVAKQSPAGGHEGYTTISLDHQRSEMAGHKIDRDGNAVRSQRVKAIGHDVITRRE